MSDWPACVAVAYSGGRDSTALLYATARLAAAQPGACVVALHVHHGISAQADAWLEHAEQQCAHWATQGLPIRLLSTRLALSFQSGDSVEAEARRARYQALADMAEQAGAEVVLLAHHRQDQAETFLLQALRGAGVAGLAAMPTWVERDGITWARPWLGRDRTEVEAYVREHGLTYIDDDTNADIRYARNRLRLTVWPALRGQFPQVDVALGQAAHHSADAQWCLQQWADKELAAMMVTPEAGQGARLDAQAWAARPAPERRELLRHWYKHVTGQGLSRAWVARLADEVPASLVAEGSAHWPGIDLGLYRGHLIWQRHVPASGAQALPPTVLAGMLEPSPCVLQIHGPGVFELPQWGGALQVGQACEGMRGLPWSCLRELRVAARTGGETFQIAANRPARSLKKQFQAAGVPAWMRGAPLFYAGEQLVFVPGLGVDGRVEQGPAQSAACLTWLSLPFGDIKG